MHNDEKLIIKNKLIKKNINIQFLISKTRGRIKMKKTND